MVSILTLIDGYYFLDTWQERLARVQQGVNTLIQQYGEPTAKNWAEWVEFAITARQQRPIIQDRIGPGSGGQPYTDALVTDLDMFVILSSDDEASKQVYLDPMRVNKWLVIPAGVGIPLIKARPFDLVGSGWKFSQETVDGINVSSPTGAGTLFDTAVAQVASLLDPNSMQLVYPESNPYQTAGGDKIVTPLMEPIIPMSFPSQTTPTEPTINQAGSPSGLSLGTIGFGTAALLGFIGFMLMRRKR